jgi:hypothetical protein
MRKRQQYRIAKGHERQALFALSRIRYLSSVLSMFDARHAPSPAGRSEQPSASAHG